MYLNENIANKVINEIKYVVDYDINIINNNGFIISSTNADRINSFHEGAYLVIEEDYNELIVEYDNQFSGCKMGVNLPIYFSDTMIGVVGITGNPDEVHQYAKIIKKMTEMIVYEYFDIWNRNNYEKIMLTFSNDLISGNVEHSLFSIEERLKMYNLQPSETFTVGLVKYSINSTKNENLNRAKHNIIKDYIIEKLSFRQSLVAFNGEFHIIISNLEEEKLFEELNYLFEKVKSQYNVKLVCSIGNTHSGYENIRMSYNEAYNLLDYVSDKKGVYRFRDFSIKVALNNIPNHYKQAIKKQVFNNCNKEEEKEYVRFIQDYLISNGSITALAKKNFIHKNTVQYKIQKIKEKTGYDLRVNHDMVVLYLATEFIKY